MKSYQQFFAELKRRQVLARALQPFPAGADVSLATYDGRMREAGAGMGFGLYFEA